MFLRYNTTIPIQIQTLSKDGIDVFSKIDAQRDIINIPKYGADAIIGYKTIEYPPCDRRGILSPIRHRYPWHL